MKVLIAEKCGFCHGVRNAIKVAEKTLSSKKDVFSFGPIIHNKDMVEKLARGGLKTVNRVEEIPSGTVLIRSHGAAPEQIKKLKENGLDIVDATCVLVKRVQRIASEFEKEGYQVVIIGEENHPEVQAVVGCAKKVIVIADKSDLNKIPRDTKLGIVCQTTQSPEHFGRMLAAIGQSGFIELKVINTLCKEAIIRQESAARICRQVDIMFVLGGLESANTRRLADICRAVNKKTYHLQNWDELDKSLLAGQRIAGVTAGASTPDWIIEEFVNNLKSF